MPKSTTKKLLPRRLKRSLYKIKRTNKIRKSPIKRLKLAFGTEHHASPKKRVTGESGGSKRHFRFPLPRAKDINSLPAKCRAKSRMIYSKDSCALAMISTGES